MKALSVLGLPLVSPIIIGISLVAFIKWAVDHAVQAYIFLLVVLLPFALPIGLCAGLYLLLSGGGDVKVP